MLGDIRTVAWKEMKEWFSSGERRSTLLSLGFSTVLAGVVFPALNKALWLESPFPVIIWVAFAASAAASMTIDAFVGERERRTLETLLASRLPDAAILLGKIAPSIAYAWGVMLLHFAVGLVAANMAMGGGFRFYQPVVALPGLALSLLASGLAASAVVLLSMRAASLQQAQAAFGMALALLFVGPALVAVLLPEEMVERWILAAQTMDSATVALIVAGFLAVLNGALLGLARLRFQRPRLLQD